METYERVCCLRGYHIFKDAWKVAVDEELACAREANKPKDRYAVFMYIYYSQAGNFHVFNFCGPSLTANIRENKVHAKIKCSTVYMYMYKHTYTVWQSVSQLSSDRPWKFVCPFVFPLYYVDKSMHMFIICWHSLISIPLLV